MKPLLSELTRSMNLKSDPHSETVDIHPHAHCVHKLLNSHLSAEVGTWRNGIEEGPAKHEGRRMDHEVGAKVHHESSMSS